MKPMPLSLAITMIFLIFVPNTSQADPAGCSNLSWASGFSPPARAARTLTYSMIAYSPTSPSNPGPYSSGNPAELFQKDPSNTGPYYYSATPLVENLNSGTASTTFGVVDHAGFYHSRAVLFQTKFPTRGTFRIAVDTGLPTPYAGDRNQCLAASNNTVVQDLPDVNFSSTPGSQIEVGTQANYSVAGYIDSLTVNSQLSYEWNFGDGTGTTSTSSTNVSHTFTANNTYTVTVRAFDGAYYSPTRSHQITIVGPTPPTVTSEAYACNNNYWTIGVEWSPTNAYSVGAYEVEASQNYGSWTQIYSGTALSMDHSAYKNTNQRFRVRACSAAGGCSLMSSISTVQLPNHCNVE